METGVIVSIQAVSTASPMSGSSVGSILGAVAFLIGAASSSLRLLAFDEAFWLVMARRILAGDFPYFDLYDNKGPLHYLFFTILEVLPGSFFIARSAAVGGIASAIFLLSSTLVKRSSLTTPGVAYVVGFGAVVMALILSSFALTTELLSLTAILAGLVICPRFPVWGLVAVIAAAGFDSRSLLFVGVYLAQLPPSERRSRPVMVALACAVTVVLAVLVVPDLRYSLVELSTGTRFTNSWNPVSQATLAAAVGLPILTLAVFGRVQRLPLWQVGLVAIALLIGVVSLFPFGHYWTYTVLILAVLRPAPVDSRLLASALVVALIPLALLGRTDVVRDSHETRSVQEAVDLARANLRTTDEVLVWSSFPQTSLRFAGQTILPSSNVNYLGWSTSRYLSNLDDFSSLLESADVIVIEANLSGVSSPFAPAAKALLAEIERRSCQYEASPSICR